MPPEGTASRAEPGEAVDFDGLYHAHFRSLTLQLTAYYGDLRQAQDLVQEAFCRAFARWSRVSRYDDPVAWVRRVAWNLATSRWRRLRTAQSCSARPARGVRAGAGPGPGRADRRAGRVAGHQRRAVVLHYLADLSVAQIAAQEDVPEGTVKSWLHRGRTALAAKLTSTNEVNHHG